MFFRIVFSRQPSQESNGTQANAAALPHFLDDACARAQHENLSKSDGSVSAPCAGSYHF
jgi:hypothetical protein